MELENKKMKRKDTFLVMHKWRGESAKILAVHLNIIFIKIGHLFFESIKDRYKEWENLSLLFFGSWLWKNLFIFLSIMKLFFNSYLGEYKFEWILFCCPIPFAFYWLFSGFSLLFLIGSQFIL